MIIIIIINNNNIIIIIIIITISWRREYSVVIQLVQAIE